MNTKSYRIKNFILILFYLFLFLLMISAKAQQCGRVMSYDCDCVSPCGITQADCLGGGTFIKDPPWIPCGLFNRDCIFDYYGQNQHYCCPETCYVSNTLCDTITQFGYSPLSLISLQWAQDNIYEYHHGGSFNNYKTKIQCFRFRSRYKFYSWQMWVDAGYPCSGATVDNLAYLLFDSCIVEQAWIDPQSFEVTPGREYTFCLLWSPSGSCEPHRKTYPFLYRKQVLIQVEPVVKTE